jgi:hypothetical protein
MPRPRPNATLVAVAVIAGLAGAVFTLQGLGAPIGRSFMIGDLRWTAIGIALLVAAVVVILREFRRR